MNAPLLIIAAGILALQVSVPNIRGREPDQWLHQRFTQTHRRGNYTTDPGQLKRFQPSGIAHKIYQLQDLVIVHNHALYWSDETAPDESKDMLASVIGFRNNKRVFAARGYKFLRFQSDALSHTM